VTDDFVAYAQPLIGEDWPSIPLVNGRQRFARLQPLWPSVSWRHVPQADRKK
jgi:6-phosphofructokinase 1